MAGKHQNHYEFLGLPIAAAPGDIEGKIAPLRLQANALAYTSPLESQELRERIRQIKEDLLSDDASRVAYDYAVLNPKPRVDRKDILTVEVERRPPPAPPSPEPTLSELVPANWAQSMPPPSQFLESRRIVAAFFQIVGDFQREQAELAAQLDGTDKATDKSQHPTPPPDEQLKVIQDARSTVEQTVGIELAQRFLPEKRPSAATGAGHGNPGQELARCLERARKGAHTSQAIVANRLFRAPGWLVQLLSVAIVLVILGAEELQQAPQSTIYGTGAVLAGCVVLLTALRAGQWTRLRASVVGVEQASADAEFWVNRAAVDEQRKLDEADQRRSRQREAVIASTRTMRRRVEEKQAAAARLEQDSGLAGASWDDSAWQRWRPISTVGPVVRLGALQARAKGQILLMPGLISFPGSHHLLIQADRRSMGQANASIQVLALRLLGTTPPGKLLITLVDPLGAADAALANACEVWSSAQEIEQGLESVSVEMLELAKRYLDGRYATMEEYYAAGAGIAEPYRLLVILDFPAGWSETSGNQLREILTVGPACGVYALVALDRERELPRHVPVDDLVRNATIISGSDHSFVWEDEVLRQCALSLDEGPESPLAERILHTVRERATTSGAVRTFEQLAAKPAHSWKETDSSEELRVAIGRIGGAPYYLRLDDDAAPHLLLLGKPSTGRAALLHTILTNSCLTYSPRELEVYMLDFHAGSTFHPYVTHQLPHARVIASEVDRGFALSVLRRVVTKLEQRREILQNSGMSQYSAFRAIRGSGNLPRVLVAIEGFGELVAQDDAITQEASALLERIVREAHACGIHLLLGTDSLARTYTRARPIIDDIAWRIGLGYGEADARLLFGGARPSLPATENKDDAVMLKIGSQEPTIFKVVPLDQRIWEAALSSVREQAHLQGVVPTTPCVTFDGNRLADISQNLRLRDLLLAPSWPAISETVPVWIGEPIALEEPTAAPIRRQPGCNLLIVGENSLAAQGVLVASLLSLAAYFPTSHVQNASAAFHVLDLMPSDDPFKAKWTRVAESLPHRVMIAGRSTLLRTMTHLVSEVDRRLTNHEPDLPPIFLFMAGLHSLQEPKISGDVTSGEDVWDAMNRQLLRILRHGPELGVHVFVWCDTVEHLNRLLDRKAIREFDLRVLFQMEAEDSRELTERSRASKLTPNQALLYGEEENRLDVFRPYGCPSEPMISAIGEEFRRRSQHSLA